MLKGKCVVVGVTGGIAAYKAAYLVRLLKKQNADVVCVMTENARQFITELTLETLSCNPVVGDMFSRPPRWDVEHIALAKRADLFIVAPATANVLAKMANGLADDMLSTTLLATKAPILVAPAMNTGMWTNAATIANMGVLKGRGVHVVGPGTGFLAEGGEGEGRMSEPEEIMEAVLSILLAKSDMAGLNVVVTAGPTREELDPVRYLTNYSSGRMGYAIARAARLHGAEVTLVSGPTSLEPPRGVKVERVVSTNDLLNAMLKAAPTADIVIQAAAPADYRPALRHDTKMKKRAGEPLTLDLAENPDVAAAIGKGKRPGQVFVVFAAETGDGLSSARGKLVRKNADMAVLNDVTLPGAGFNVSTNIAVLVGKDFEESLPLMSKDELAGRILDRALLLREAANG